MPKDNLPAPQEDSQEFNQSILDKFPEWKQARIQLVAEELIQGHSALSIAKRHAKEWEVDPYTVRSSYVKFARRLLAENILKNPDEIKDDLMVKYHDLYQIAYESNNYRECRQILNAISNCIFGSKLDITSNGQTISNIKLIQINHPDEIQDAQIIEPNNE